MRGINPPTMPRPVQTCRRWLTTTGCDGSRTWKYRWSTTWRCTGSVVYNELGRQPGALRLWHHPQNRGGRPSSPRTLSATTPKRQITGDMLPIFLSAATLAATVAANRTAPTMAMTVAAAGPVAMQATTAEAAGLTAARLGATVTSAGPARAMTRRRADSTGVDAVPLTGATRGRIVQEMTLLS